MDTISFTRLVALCDAILDTPLEESFDRACVAGLKTLDQARDALVEAECYVSAVSDTLVEVQFGDASLPDAVFVWPTRRMGSEPVTTSEEYPIDPAMFRQTLTDHGEPLMLGLNEYDEQPGFLRDTLRTMQDDYYARFAQFVEL